MMASSSSLLKIILNQKVVIYIHEINIIILSTQQEHWKQMSYMHIWNYTFQLKIIIFEMSWIQQCLVCFHNKLKHMFCKLNNYHDYVTLTSTKWKINIIELCMYAKTFIYEIWIINILIKIIWTIVFFSKLEKLLMQFVIVVCLYMFHISWQRFSTKDEIVPITIVIAILTLIMIKKKPTQYLMVNNLKLK
jgi:hypothetical protein